MEERHLGAAEALRATSRLSPYSKEPAIGRLMLNTEILAPAYRYLKNKRGTFSPYRHFCKSLQPIPTRAPGLAMPGRCGPK